jgi:hypothetical protein
LRDKDWIEFLYEDGEVEIDIVGDIIWHANLVPKLFYRLTKKYEAAKGDGWLPIDRLKPNVRVILTFNFTDVYAGQLEDDGMFYDGSYGIPTPTHWQPLPTPPTKAEGE